MMELENSAHLLINQIGEELKYADFVTSSNDSSWQIENRLRGSLNYIYTDTSLYRNGRSVLQEGIGVDNFSVNLHGVSSEDHHASSFVQFSFELRMKQSRILLSSGISRRNIEKWAPMPVLRDTSMMPE